MQMNMTTQETPKNGAPKAEAPKTEATQTRVLVPPVDVLENAEEILVLADLPGVHTDDVTLHLDKGLLSLVAERKSSAWGRAVQYKRTFQVPPDVDAEGVEARSDNGVLTLKLPRRASAKPRSIAVKSGA
jgi:HSP20 family molecular chaperone IbpA